MKYLINKLLFYLINLISSDHLMPHLDDSYNLETNPNDEKNKPSQLETYN